MNWSWLTPPVRRFIYAVWGAALALIISQGWLPQEAVERFGAAVAAVLPLILAYLKVPTAVDTDPTPAAHMPRGRHSRTDDAE